MKPAPFAPAGRERGRIATPAGRPAPGQSLRTAAAAGLALLACLWGPPVHALGLPVSAKDRDFWAFRPPRAVPVPAVRDAGRVRNPIDAFILQRLEQKGLSLSPDADRGVLVRRVC